MSVQTSVSLRSGAAVAGMLADSGPVDIMSRVLETAGGTQFGRFVARGATPGKTTKILSAAGDVAIIEGVSVFTALQEGGASPDISQYEEVSVMRSGRIWLLCQAAIAVTDTLYVIRDGSASAGLLTASATGTTAIGSGVHCLIGAGAGEYGLFQVHFV